MYTILETLHQQLSWPFVCYIHAVDVAPVKVTFDRWRFLVPPDLRAMLKAPPEMLPILTKQAQGWRVIVERPDTAPEEIIFHTDEELAFWWKYHGPLQPPSRAENLTVWMASQMTAEIIGDWPLDVLEDELQGEVLRLEAQLERFYQKVSERLQERLGRQEG